MSKKGDIVDAIIAYQVDPALGGLQGYAVISDYPENIQSILKLFISIWMIPEQVIPSRKNSSRYKEWVKELNHLEYLCAKSRKEIMERAHKRYNDGKMNFLISRPASINSLVTTVISEMNREARSSSFQRRMDELGIPKEEPKQMDGKEIKGLSAELRKLIEE